MGIRSSIIDGRLNRAERGAPSRASLVRQVVSRLTEQKGLPLILHGLHVTQQRGAQFVVLGSAPEGAVQAGFQKWAAELASGPHGRLVLRYDEALSHRIYAGADIILIPSFFEPCGLTQLIGLRSVAQHSISATHFALNFVSVA
jgi:starch synthase